MKRLMIYTTDYPVSSQTVLKDLFGDDFMVNDEHYYQGYYYSVTHCDRHLLVIKHHLPIGIDLEKVGERRPRIENEIFHPNERKLIKNGKDFTKIWTLKEAYGKLLGIGIQKCLHQVDLSEGIEHAFKKNDYYFLSYEYKQYILSIATPNFIESVAYYPLDFQDKLINSIIEEFSRVLKRDLVGIYFHGSYALKDYDPYVSDLDYLVVVNKEISEKKKLQIWEVVSHLNRYAPKKGLEFSIVQLRDCQNPKLDFPYQFHYSPKYLKDYVNDPVLTIKKLQGTDWDLAGYGYLIKQKGIALFGKAIDEVFQNFSYSLYLKALWFDLKDALDHAEEPETILNISRTMELLDTKEIVSKSQGGKWASEKLEEKELINKALIYYHQGLKFHKEETWGFIEKYLTIIKTTISA